MTFLPDFDFILSMLRKAAILHKAAFASDTGK